MNRIKFGISALLATGALSLGASSVLAQGPGGGGFQMPPDMKIKIDALRKYGEQHKKATNLSLLLYQIKEMDKDPQYTLNKPQATKMMGILSAWRTKPEMSEDQASTVSKNITNILTDKQLKKVSTITRKWGGGGGGGRPGGGGPPGGGAPRKFDASMIPDPPKGNINPLNPDTSPGMMKGMAQKQMDELTAQLKAAK